MSPEKKETFPQVRIKLVKSVIGRTERQRAVVKSLGLGKLNSEVVQTKTPQIAGMINKVNFLLEVTEVEK